jgi:hypothetical protein
VRTFVEQVAALPARRVHRTKRHPLLDMVGLAIWAVLCGAEGWEDMDMFAEVPQVWGETFLEFPHGMPSPDTLRRVLARREPEACGGHLLAWVQAVAGVPQGQGVAMDGKPWRRAHARAGGPAAIPMGSAGARAHRLGLGQVQTDDQSQAMTAIPE